MEPYVERVHVWQRQRVARFRRDAEDSYSEHRERQPSAPYAYALGVACAQVLMLCDLAESLIRRLDALLETHPGLEHDERLVHARWQFDTVLGWIDPSYTPAP